MDLNIYFYLLLIFKFTVSHTYSDLIVSSFYMVAQVTCQSFGGATMQVEIIYLHQAMSDIRLSGRVYYSSLSGKLEQLRV